MKMEECIESIFGCLERIEDKINGLSVPLPEGNSPTVNNTQDESMLNAGQTHQIELPVNSLSK